MTNPNNPKTKITSHGCIKEVPIEQLGQEFSCPKGWNSKLAWALYVFDVNKVAPKEQIIRSTLDVRVSAKDLKSAITIIQQKQESTDPKEHLKLLNSFKFEAGFMDGFKPELIASKAQVEIQI